MRYVRGWGSFDIAEDALKGDHKTLTLKQHSEGVWALICKWDCPLRPVSAVVASWVDARPLALLERIRFAHEIAKLERRKRFGHER